MAEATDKPNHERQLYHAMVNFADTAIGNLTDLLKSKGMWEDTVVVFSADNGGPIYNNGSAGANNYPLKGGKMNSWEGGIRVNSWVSGGFLPQSVRGTLYEGLVTGWDWYATFCGFAGVDPTDHRAAVANLPAIDSYDHSPMILGLNFTSPRTEIPIGSNPVATNMSSAPLCIDSIRRGYNHTTWDPAEPGSRLQPVPTHGKCTTVNGIIVDEGANGIWKLLIGDVQQDVYTGPHYPNISTDEISANFVGHCSDGCLYNIKADPLESNDLAAKMPEKRQELYDKIVKYESTAFNPDRGKISKLACKAAVEKYDHFWGTFVFP